MSAVCQLFQQTSAYNMHHFSIILIKTERERARVLCMHIVYHIDQMNVFYIMRLNVENLLKYTFYIACRNIYTLHSNEYDSIIFEQ